MPSSAASASAATSVSPAAVLEADPAAAETTLAETPPAPARSADDRELDRPRLGTCLWFALLHVACFAAIWTGVSWTAAIACAVLYAARMFALTAGYHRHFAHRSYETSRVFRFLLGMLGTTAIQKGPLWWAATHRAHHRWSDHPGDPHSPVERGFWWAHVGWILGDRHAGADLADVRDIAKYPELRWLDRWHLAPPIAVIVLLYVLGEGLGAAWHTSGLQLVVWGMVISTVLLYHGVWTVNSLVHIWGTRRYATTDNSRNNGLVALWTFGEGWHNNHHRFPASEQQGFRWWQIDISHLGLRTLSLVGLVWGIKKPPRAILEEAREGRSLRRASARSVVEVAAAAARTTAASDPATP
jgi:stearoyl-CoA desaturase (Delta-9 desaturase)